MKKATFYNWTQIVFLAVALALRCFGGITATVGYAAIAGYSLCGRANVVQALGFVWLFTYLNPGLAPSATHGPTMKYVVFGTCFVSVIIRTYRSSDLLRPRALTLYTVALGTFFILHSFLFSQIADLSALKSASWMLAAVTLVATWAGLSFEERKQTERQLFGGLLAIGLLSVPLLFIDTGYLLNGYGFQGVLAHPQVFGPVIALVAAWLTATALTTRSPPAWLMGSLGICFIEIVASQARTAALSWIAAVAGVLVLARLVSPRGTLFPGTRSMKIQLLLVGAAITAVLAAPVLFEGASRFVRKGSGATLSTVEAMSETRAGLVERMLPNIGKYPLTGIGFGIASDLSDAGIELDPLTGLPLSAPVEKGVLPVAVMEELGILGVVAVGAWLLMIIRRATKARIPEMCVLLAVLISNLSEATLLSSGGNGLLLLIVLAWSATSERASLVRASFVSLVPEESPFAPGTAERSVRPLHEASPAASKPAGISRHDGANG